LNELTAKGEYVGSISLTQKEFNDLLEYSTSVPTGTTLGKVWKRGVYVFEKDGET